MLANYRWRCPTVRLFVLEVEMELEQPVTISVRLLPQERRILEHLAATEHRKLGTVIRHLLLVEGERLGLKAITPRPDGSRG